MTEEDDDLHRAQALINVGRPDDAAEILGRVLAREPDSFAGHCLMAVVESAREGYAAMRHHAERAIAIQPDREWGHRLCSIAQRNLRYLDEAVREAELSVRLGPFSPMAYANLADCHLMYEGTAAAQRAYKAARFAVDLAPEDPDTHLTLGRAHSAAGDSPSAQSCYERALALDPLHSAARNNLAVVQLRGGRYTTAGRNLIDALAVDPHQDLLQRNLLHAVNAWLSRRADIAAVLWIGAWTGALLPYPVAQRVLYGLLAVGVVAGIVVPYRSLPTVMRRLIRKPPSRRHSGRVLAWICTALPFASLVLRAAAPDSLRPVVTVVNGLAIAAVFVTGILAYNRAVAGIERLQRRWAHRMFLRQEERSAETAVKARDRFVSLRLLLIRWPVAGTLISVGVLAAVVAHARTDSKPPPAIHVGQCLRAGSDVVSTDRIVRCEDVHALYRVAAIAALSTSGDYDPCVDVSEDSQAVTVIDGAARILCLTKVRRVF